MIRNVVLLFVAVGLAGVLHAQTFTDIGAAAPSPGTNDIYQLSTQGNQTWPERRTNQLLHRQQSASRSDLHHRNQRDEARVGRHQDGGVGFRRRLRHAREHADVLSEHLFDERQHGDVARHGQRAESRFHRRRLAEMERAERAAGNEQNLRVFFRQTANRAAAMRRWPWRRTPTPAAKSRSFPSAAARSPPAAATSLTRCSILVCKRRPPIYPPPCRGRIRPTG